MDLPVVIAVLVRAQNEFDSVAYTGCFSATAVVFDEGHTHTGKSEIQQWIAAANKKYKTVMKPLNYQKKGGTFMLTAEVSGTFPGSPIMLQYYFKIENGLIQSLKITG